MNIQQITKRSLIIVAMLLLGAWQATVIGSTAVVKADSMASPTQGMDVILVMDSSGSMKKNDPQELRKPAAKLFVSLLGKDDRASIVSFSDNGYPVAFLTSVKGEKNREKLFNAIERISTKGVSTNLQGAIEGAQQVLKKSAAENRKRVIILMTDGKMDAGSDEKNIALTQQLLNETLPALKQQHIDVHTIAFTAQSDQTLLKQIADKTGGTFNLSHTDKELHDVYTSIFEQSKSPNMLPFNGEKFSIDNAVKEVTIVGSKDSADTVLSLLSPTGQMITAKDNNKKIKWFVSQQFDLITISKPLSGEWQIKSSTGKNKAYVITDLRQKLEISPRKPAINEGVLIKTWIEDKGKIITKPSVLDSVAAELHVITPDKQTHTLAMEPEVTDEGVPANSGAYTSLIALPENGKYKMSVVIKSQTFSREKNSTVKVQDKPAVTSQAKPESKTKVTEKQPPENHVPQPAVAKTDKAAHEPPQEKHDGENVGKMKEPHDEAVNKPVAPKKPEAKEKKKDKSKKDKKTKKEKGQNKKGGSKVKPTENIIKKEDNSVLFGILIFIGINILLIGIGAGIYFFIKKKRNKADTGNDHQESDEEVTDKAA